MGGECVTNHTETFAYKLLDDACKRKTSDIHFHPFPDKDKIDIYYRLLGKRTYIRTIKSSLYQVLLTYFKFSSGMDIGETRKPQNGILSHKSDHKHFSLRLSTLPSAFMESLTIRILPQEESTVLDQLFLFPNQFKKMRSWLRYPAGIILMTGPTG